jgi:Glycosyl hydrolase 108
MKINWAWVGFGGVLLAVLATNKKVKESVVDILKSVERTFKNEGGWEPETAPRANKDIGNYHKGVYYGTNHGVTARFLVDNFAILQIPLMDKNTIKNLTPEQCADIFLRTEGARMRYSEMTHQAVADFLFDWMIHRPGNTEKSGGCVYFMEAKIFGMPVGSALKAGSVYSDELVKRINATDPATLYNSLKYWRLWHMTYTNTYKSFLKGIYNRIARFKDFDPTAEVHDMLVKAQKRAWS